MNSEIDIKEHLRRSFGFEGFRAHQEDVCRHAMQGHDVLLVMPTGAGKSLCYQLPGLVRQGTCLVISPLIALMEDQVHKLKEQGLRAEAIHSGRSRMESRQACAAYLSGELQYLFIAPERLRVPGFPELLSRRTPSLIAVDEAHCISQWGHDFRPDYRLLQERLEKLRPCPVMALTATATPLVQQDIVEQLGLRTPRRFVHGFRRRNIAIEIANRKRGERLEEVRRLLKDPCRRPAIVYAPTRSEAETFAQALSMGFSTKPYHAGLGSMERQRVQMSFLSGELEVVVATVAFGMGIDKPDVRTIIHTSLPGSLEGYYQEIGRAGRDGNPSRAVLMYSYGDLKMHEYFFEQSYPAASELEKIFSKVKKVPQKVDELAATLRISDDHLNAMMDKLLVHGGITLDREGDQLWIRRGLKTWKSSYLKQRKHRENQIKAVHDFARSGRCRMLQLVEHFGDQNDVGSTCGLCDVCAPETGLAVTIRPPSRPELRYMQQIIRGLLREDNVATGQLYRRLYPSGSPERPVFEGLLDSLTRAELVQCKDDSFEKKGKVIKYRRIQLTVLGFKVRDNFGAESGLTVRQR